MSLPQHHINRKLISSWEDLARREYKLPGVSVFYVQENHTLKGAVAKKMTPESKTNLCKSLLAKEEDVVVVAVGATDNAVS